MSLLPKSYSEFKDKEYWETFFRNRGNVAFEWYGEFGNIFEEMKTVVESPQSKILSIGCGNSDFSSNLYDKGFTSITNIDFSTVVIEEMKLKNIHRQQMKWLVGDMTNMPEISDGSCDIVFDKGALDAILSENIETVISQTTKMFGEIERVLNSTGKYICITLAEDFVVRALFSHFCNWKIDIYSVPSSAPSPFLALMIVLQKRTTIQTPILDIQSFVDAVGNKRSEPLHQSLEKTLDMVRCG